MILGISLDAAINLIGHLEGTTTRELVSAIRKHGRDCPDQLRRYTKNSDFDTAILKILPGPKANHWHWIAWDMGTIYDPAYNVPILKSPGPITGYLPIE